LLTFLSGPDQETDPTDLPIEALEPPTETEAASEPEVTPDNLIPITPLLADDLYFWRVWAQKLGGSWSGWSNADSFTITP
jgi:hypothetical protein